MMLLWRWFDSYRRHIVARAERDGSIRLRSIQAVMVPWLVPLLAVAGLDMVLDLPEGWSQAMTLVVGGPAAVGVIYAGGLYLWASIKTDGGRTPF